MIRYRPFRNSDPPAISEIWRSQKSTRSLAQSVTPAVLDRLVFSKPYFDREGFLVAEEDGRPIGFAHAGFAANEQLDDLDRTHGVIALILVAPHREQDAVAAELLKQAEDYLQQNGAQQICLGGAAPRSAPFYLGLFGGSNLAGVPESNELLSGWALTRNAKPVRRLAIMQQSLAGFRPLVNRDQMQIRRGYQIEAELDPSSNSWWEACTVGFEHRTRFSLMARVGGAACGAVTYWDMEPLASSWGVHACGLLSVEIEEPHRRNGLGTFLVGESLRQMQSQGATLAEGQVDETNAAGLALFRKLGFEQVDVGVVYQLDL